jgi:hypothetical protein
MRLAMRSFSAATGLLLLLVTGHAWAVDADPDISSEEAKQFLQLWANAQNTGDFPSYASLYGVEFSGVRRSGKARATMQLDEWLKDRERMFKTPMRVSIEGESVEPGMDTTAVSFRQTWSSGAFADVGKKAMTLRRNPDGKIVIVGEEMMCSLLVKKNGHPVLNGKAADRDVATRLYPDAEFLASPKSVDADCSPEKHEVWSINVSERKSFVSEGIRYDIVIWNESYNPEEGTTIGKVSGGGVLITRDAARLLVDDATNCQIERIFPNRKGFVLAVSSSESWRGYSETRLKVFQVADNAAYAVDSVTILDDDDAGQRTYAYRAKVEYKDVDGNGITDIVITPVKRKNVGKKYSKERKVIPF